MMMCIRNWGFRISGDGELQGLRLINCSCLSVKGPVTADELRADVVMALASFPGRGKDLVPKALAWFDEAANSNGGLPAQEELSFQGWGVIIAIFPYSSVHNLALDKPSIHNRLLPTPLLPTQPVSPQPRAGQGLIGYCPLAGRAWGAGFVCFSQGGACRLD